MKAMSLLVVLALLAAACSREETPVAERGAEVPPAAEEAAIPGVTAPIPMEYEEPVVGGAVMAAGKDIMSNIVNSSEHTTLVRVLQASALDQTLQEQGPLTMFAPTNAAFERLPSGMLDDLLKPANQDRLVKVLTYHIVSGRLDADALAAQVMAGNGSAMLRTVQGASVKATVGDGRAILVDAKGRVAHLSTPNVLQSNGVMHVIDQVLLPD